jgi:hypothetical protein
MKTNNRTKAQDLILLAHKFQNSTIPGKISISDILLALDESGLILCLPQKKDNTARFALQLMDNPTLTEFDSSIEIVV